MDSVGIADPVVEDAAPLAGWLLTVGGTALWLGGGALGLAGATLLVTLWPRLPARASVRE